MPRFVLICALAVSICANLWLVARRADSSPSFVTGSATSSAEKSRGAARSGPEGMLAAPTAKADELGTSQVLSRNDLQSLRLKLEGLGLPADLVRAMMASAIQRNMVRRGEALNPPPAPNEYWKNRNFSPDFVVQAAFREIEREQRQLMREFVGNSLDGDEQNDERQFGGLPRDKIARLKKIFSDYSDLEEQMFADGVERSPTENRARADLLAKEKRADLERLLSPEELLQYDLRNSPASHRLRSQLGRFDATEAEFLALYPAFQTAMSQMNGNSVNARGNSAEMRRVREENERVLDAEMRRVLGDSRYAELKEANDHQLQQTRAFTTSLNLPATAAAEVLAVQREIAPKLLALDRDRDLTSNQRDARAGALGIEARDRLVRVLGVENFELYKRRGGGWVTGALGRAPAGTNP